MSTSTTSLRGSRLGASTSAPAVELRGVRYRYPGASTDALTVERLIVAPGEQVFVRGPSGCGKTTLLSLIAGVLVANAGEVSLHGQDWAKQSASARDLTRADHIGYIFQQFNLLPYLSVLDNVLLPCRFSVIRAHWAAQGEGGATRRALALLEQMGLDADYADRSAGLLSVGQQQRVAAARALIGRPDLIIADEPTSALDEEVREAFMRVLLTACTEAHSALIFVSHDARLAARFARQVDLQSLNGAISRRIVEAQP